MDHGDDGRRRLFTGNELCLHHRFRVCLRHRSGVLRGRRRRARAVSIPARTRRPSPTMGPVDRGVKGRRWRSTRVGHDDRGGHERRVERGIERRVQLGLDGGDGPMPRGGRLRGRQHRRPVVHHRLDRRDGRQWRHRADVRDPLRPDLGATVQRGRLPGHRHLSVGSERVPVAAVPVCGRHLVRGASLRTARGSSGQGGQPRRDRLGRPRRADGSPSRTSNTAWSDLFSRDAGDS